MKRSRILLAILGILVLAAGLLWGANGVIGSSIAEKIDQKIKTCLIEKEKVPLRYASLDVTPIAGFSGGSIWSSLEVRSVGIGEPGGKDLVLEAERITLRLPMSMASQFADSDPGDCSSILRSSTSSLSDGVEVIADRLRLRGREGHVEIDASIDRLRQYLRGNPRDIFFGKTLEGGEATQALVVETDLEGFKTRLPEETRALVTSPEAQDRLSRVDRIALHFRIDPASRRITLDEFTVRSPLGKGDARGTFDYTGGSLLMSDPKAFDFDASFSAKGEGVKVGDMATVGVVGWDSISSRLRAKGTYENGHWSIQSGASDFDLKNLNLTPGKKVWQQFMSGKEPLGLSDSMLQMFRIDDLTWEVKLEGGLLSIPKLVFKSPLFSLDLTAATRMDWTNLEESRIESGKLVISNIANEMAGVVRFAEEMNRRPFPREGQNIVLQFEGTFKNPQIKW